MSFLDFIKNKKIGTNIGLEKLNKAMLGIQQGAYYLIGGSSGSGKTTFVDYSFFLQPLVKSKDVKIFYYSYEIPEYRKYAKMISYSLYVQYKYEYSDMEVMNRTERDISDIMSKIENSYADFKKLIRNKVHFTFSAVNPTQVYKDLKKYSEENGKYIKTPIYNDKGELVKTEESYIPNNPDELVIVIIDHIGLSQLERGYNKKQNMDKLSEYMVYFRNICNYSPVLIQQLNRSISNIERQKLRGDDLLPTDADFSDTSNTFQDADVVLTSFSPFKYGIKSFRGINLDKNNRIISVLKNRFGETDVSIIVDFKGKVNYIKEL